MGEFLLSEVSYGRMTRLIYFAMKSENGRRRRCSVSPGPTKCVTFVAIGRPSPRAFCATVPRAITSPTDNRNARSRTRIRIAQRPIFISADRFWTFGSFDPQKLSEMRTATIGQSAIALRMAIRPSATAWPTDPGRPVGGRVRAVCEFLARPIPISRPSGTMSRIAQKPSLFVISTMRKRHAVGHTVCDRYHC